MRGSLRGLPSVPTLWEVGAKQRDSDAQQEDAVIATPCANRHEHSGVSRAAVHAGGVRGTSPSVRPSLLRSLCPEPAPKQG
jgi:hypothetical protein